MAAIDHTVIVFKNGEWMKEPYLYDENDDYINHCPFDYGRDGNIHTINGKRIWDDITWYRDPGNAYYERAGWNSKHASLLARLKWFFHIMNFVCYEREVGVLRTQDEELYIYRNSIEQCYVSFYNDSKGDTYIVLGGYGHHNNVYTHFMHRGYGEEFEEKMAYEAYEWCVDDVLEMIADDIFEGYWESEDGRLLLQKTFGVGLKDGYLKSCIEAGIRNRGLEPSKVEE